MCLITTRPTPQIATKDIICYKIVQPKQKKSIFDKILNRRRFQSYVFDFQYIRKKLYRQSKLTFADSIYNPYICKCEFVIEEAFHSYAYPLKSCLGVTVRCKIPKGSFFYEGYINKSDIKGYASNQIIILDELHSTTN